MHSHKRIAILGRPGATDNYIRFLHENGYLPVPTLNPGEVVSCGGLLLPGGGDITPAFFGEANHGSVGIDTELDILQLRALELCLRSRLPVLGICKGMQLINVALGGTIVQRMDTADRHRYNTRDQYHTVINAPDSFFAEKWGPSMTVNSAHHQCIGRPGRELIIAQRCPEDNCPEALVHPKFPLLAVQWHPERMPELSKRSPASAVLAIFDG